VGIAKLQPIFVFITALMYIVVLVLYLLDYLLYSSQYLDVSESSNPVEMAIYLFGVTIYTFTSIGFVLYGMRIYFKFSSVPIYTNTRKQVVRKIQVISMLVSLCFLTRSGIIVVGTLYNISQYWWFDGIYFSVLELVPLFMMLQLLHGDSRRVNKQASTDRTALISRLSSVPLALLLGSDFQPRLGRSTRAYLS